MRPFKVKTFLYVFVFILNRGKMAVLYPGPDFLYQKYGNLTFEQKKIQVEESKSQPKADADSCKG